MEKERFYLISAPWWWTFVGRYVGNANFQEIWLEDAIYFTYTGATFDILAVKGMRTDSKYHKLPGRITIPANSIKIPWLAPTPWVEEKPHVPGARLIDKKKGGEK